MGFRQDHLHNFVLFDIERFRNDFLLYVFIPMHDPVVIINPSKGYVKTFMKRANIHPTCLWYGMFWDLYLYKVSLEWLDLVTNKKEVTKDERIDERGTEHEESILYT